MKLSIGMIVKNEEKTLEKCINGLLGILNNVDSELIIGDTGSTDNTKNIAIQFTKNVFDIVWKNNFADARNETLNAASGEWFMFVDADEIFVDTAEIVNFFNSGDYKNFNCADHYMTQLLSGGAKNTNIASRLFKKTDKTRFYGLIHEYITGIPPRKLLNSTSLHDGYNFDFDEEKKDRKHKRNLELLTQEYKNDKHNLRILVHLIKEYELQGDALKALEYLHLAYGLVKDAPKNQWFHFIHHHFANAYLKQNKIAECKAICDNYFKLQKELFVSFIPMSFIYGIASFRSNDLKHSISQLQNALNYQKIYEKGGEINTFDMNTDNLVLLDGVLKEKAIDTIVECFIGLNAFDQAFIYLEKIDDWEKNCTLSYLEVVAKSRKFHKIVPLFKTLFSDEKTDFYLIDKFLNMCDEKIEMIEFIICNLDFDTPYLHLLKIKYGSPAQQIQSYSFFISANVKISSFFASVLVFALKNKENIDLIFEKTEVEDHDFFVDEALKSIESLNIETMMHQNFSTLKAGNFMIKYFYTVLSRQIGIVKNSEKSELFSLFVNLTCQFALLVFSKDIFTHENISVLPKVYRFAIAAQEALALENYDEEAYAHKLKAPF